MTTYQIGVLTSIVLMAVGISGLYYTRRNAARELQRQRQEDQDRAVKEATRPLQERIADLTGQLDRQERAHAAEMQQAQRVNDRQAARIDVLEDELRRGRGYAGPRET